MTDAPELHHPVLVAGLPAAGSDVTVRADAAQRAAIADRLRIPAVARLVCRYHLVPGQDGMVMARGVLEAEVTQVCVVSLDPFDSVLRDEFRLRFVPLRGEDDAPELLDDPESDDEIVYEGRLIDLGEAAVEQLALALDPYPRKPGAELPGLPQDDASGPFGALARLRRPH